MKLIVRVLFLWFVVFPRVAFCQNDTGFFSRVVGGLKVNSDKNPIEKVHLQLDKPFYNAGDDIWFKAYVVAGSKHQLSAISGILNVDLINPGGVIEQSVKLPLANGLTWGDFKLPDTLSTGNYRVRAYTQWMRNAGAEYFYNLTIPVVNNMVPGKPAIDTSSRKKTERGSKQVLPVKYLSTKIDVQFFPEGGNLVYGINSKVAFKAIGDDGLGKNIKGVVIDESNQEITRFSSGRLGMGVFNLSPVSGKTYMARLSYPDGSEKTIDLPTPVKKGYVLQVNNSDSLHISVKIDASSDLLNDSAKSRIYLVAQSGGSAYYLANSTIHGAALTAVIPASKFPSGVVLFTLFSAAGEPLNERLVFIQNSDQLNLYLSANKSQFKTRNQVKIDMLAKNNQGQPALGNFSVAVTDESKVPANETDESTIFSNLLLTSEIKGYIEKPNYYFATVNQQTREDLDVLMLTQGYRRFEWKKILNNDFGPVVYPPETGLSITGRLKTLGDRPLAHGKVSLLSSSAGFFMVDTVADDNGYFAFKNLQFKDSVQFVIQSKTVKNKTNVKIELDTNWQAPVITEKYKLGSKANIDTLPSAYLASSKNFYDEQIKYGIGNHIKVLKEVKIKERKILANSSNLNGPGNADQVLLMKNVSTACPSIAACLQGKLNFVTVSLDSWGVGSFYSRNGKMAIYVDGFPSTPELLNNIQPESIESVEVLINSGLASIYGPGAIGGVVLINTKKITDGETYTPLNIISFAPKGYYKAREYYSPKYDNTNIKLKTPDLRSTVYWNPNVPTDKDGKAFFEYFNTDAKGTFKVVIEGIDSYGNLGRVVYHYRIE